MDLTDRLEHVAVVGAAGKMGRGIAQLLALELTWRALEHPDRSFVLDLIDADDAALQALVRFLHQQAAPAAEKQIHRLRQLYRDRPDLVDNEDMVRAFGLELLFRLRPGRTLALARDARLVFEAAFEREATKTAIYTELAGLCGPDTWFLSNTSSLPIQALSEACGLRGRMLGFHFYNPPAVQKLVELIRPRDADPGLVRLADALARALGKQTVASADIAGFIGNGHFVRDGLFAIRTLERLAPRFGFVPALHLVEQVSRDWLVRPMGCFQLMDFVGLDVVQQILRVMAGHLGPELHSDLLDRMLDRGVRGGQAGDGSPRPGFQTYRQGRPAGIFDPDTGEYAALDAPWARAAEAQLGPAPEAHAWKALRQAPDCAAQLAEHFQRLRQPRGLGDTLAREHFLASRQIGLDLVAQGVAASAEAVNQVLTLGFFHLYGPISDALE
jgi:3-hydroxyacyl-CoA dehydrogenase